MPFFADFLWRSKESQCRGVQPPIPFKRNTTARHTVALRQIRFSSTKPAFFHQIADVDFSIG
ncbi:hypothetical protein [Chitinibacter sp. S2-10]|uniref:hypothetical protein n=1 Tax=Chitinibacter sp. S2-10 TaxID=3373597 RepID=UPI00397746A0